jgi:hypothetical protein
MSARLFAALAAPHGLAAERQIRSWSEGRYGLGAYGDVITALRKEWGQTP